VNAVAPSSGPASGDLAVMVLGGGFTPDSVVTFAGSPGTDVTVLDPTFLYLFSPPLSPGTLNDVSVSISTTPGNAIATKIGAFFADFTDVPQIDPFHDYVEKIFRNGITAGCAAGSYCPQDAVTRAQMAVFLLKSKHGAAYVPPACAGIFGDVPCPSMFVDWIEQLAAEGITAGCGNGNYCPSNPVTRAQMAAFLLRAEHGSTYVPPPCGGLFLDVACPSLFADWIEQLAAEQITGGCGGGNYCPSNPNTRAQMSAFLVKTFGM
jgi:S-layer homology domain/IPT/TIG domain